METIVLLAVLGMFGFGIWGICTMCSPKGLFVAFVQVILFVIAVLCIGLPLAIVGALALKLFSYLHRIVTAMENQAKPSESA